MVAGRNTNHQGCQTVGSHFVRNHDSDGCTAFEGMPDLEFELALEEVMPDLEEVMPDLEEVMPDLEEVPVMTLVDFAAVDTWVTHAPCDWRTCGWRRSPSRLG